MAEGPASQGNYLLVAAYTWGGVDGEDRTLLKYSKDGNLFWSALFPDPVPGKYGGFEFIHMLSDGGAVVAGFVNGDPSVDLMFKSYGNVEETTASVTLFPGSALNSNSVAPTLAQATWDRTYAPGISVKSVKPLSGDGGGGFVFAAPRMNAQDAQVVSQQLHKSHHRFHV
jgi:hypothetical protein